MLRREPAPLSLELGLEWASRWEEGESVADDLEVVERREEEEGTRRAVGRAEGFKCAGRGDGEGTEPFTALEDEGLEKILVGLCGTSPSLSLSE